MVPSNRLANTQLQTERQVTAYDAAGDQGDALRRQAWLAMV
jgi:hypothetical protein